MGVKVKVKVKLGLSEEEEVKGLTSDQPGSLLGAAEQMLRLKHRGRNDFSALRLVLANVALTNNKTWIKDE